MGCGTSKNPKISQPEILPEKRISSNPFASKPSLPPNPSATKINNVDSIPSDKVLKSRIVAIITIQSQWRKFQASRELKRKLKALRLLQNVVRFTLAKFAAKRLRIQQKFRQIEEMNCVGILVLKYAVGLRSADSNGFSDPYALIHSEPMIRPNPDIDRTLFSLTHQTRSCYKSAVIFKSVNPVWNESCLLTGLGGLTCLCLTILDRDEITSDECLGQVRLNLRDYPQLFDFPPLPMTLPHPPPTSSQSSSPLPRPPPLPSINDFFGPEVEMRGCPLLPLLSRPLDDHGKEIPFDLPSPSISPSSSPTISPSSSSQSLSSLATNPLPPSSPLSFSSPSSLLSASPQFPSSLVKGNLTFCLRLLSPHAALSSWAMKYSRSKKMKSFRPLGLLPSPSSYKRRFIVLTPSFLSYFDDEKSLHSHKARFSTSSISLVCRVRDSSGEEGLFIGVNPSLSSSPSDSSPNSEGWLLQLLDGRGDGEKNSEKNLLRLSREGLGRWERAFRLLCPGALVGDLTGAGVGVGVGTGGWLEETRRALKGNKAASSMGLTCCE